MLATTEARDDLVKHMEEQYDRELLEMASARVKLRVAPQTWEAFYLTAVEGLSGAEAAEHVGMQVSQVFVAKHRVQKLLREEIHRADR
jgi:RNA polymerase sigma-70 factor (ECF subfamily)